MVIDIPAGKGKSLTFFTVYQERNQGEMNLKALLNNRENFPHIQGKVIGGARRGFLRKCGEAYSQITCTIIYNGIASNTDFNMWKKNFEDEFSKIGRAVEKTDD